MLTEAAEDVDNGPGDWPGRPPNSRRRRLSLPAASSVAALAGAVIAVLVVAIALTAGSRRQTGASIVEHGWLAHLVDLSITVHCGGHSHPGQRGARDSGSADLSPRDGCVVSSAYRQRASPGEYRRCRKRVLLLQHHARRKACPVLRSSHPVNRILHRRERAPSPRSDLRMLRGSPFGLKPMLNPAGSPRRLRAVSSIEQSFG